MNDLIKRLRDTASKGVSVWGDLQMEAAKEIEILTAEREAYASAMDRMKTRLAEVESQFETRSDYVGQLRQQLAEVEKDAARYRWLRSLAKESRLEAAVATGQWDYFAPEKGMTRLDAAIDAAMNKEQP